MDDDAELDNEAGFDGETTRDETRRTVRYETKPD